MHSLFSLSMHQLVCEYWRTSPNGTLMCSGYLKLHCILVITNWLHYSKMASLKIKNEYFGNSIKMKRKFVVNNKDDCCLNRRQCSSVEIWCKV